MALERIVLHIGMPKTGTSVIQSHLSQNRRALRDNGVFYPVTISHKKHLYRTFESHHLLTYSLAGLEPFTAFDAEAFMRRAERACSRYGMRVMLLSAENAYWLPKAIVTGPKPDETEFRTERRRYIERIKNCFSACECSIVVYFRRQDRWIESWFNQQIKNGNHISEDVESVADKHHVLLDYASVLEDWGEAFGKDNITVRAYEKQQLTDGLFSDFCDSVGLGDAEVYPLCRKARHNAQLRPDAMRFMNLCNAIPTDGAQGWWLRMLIRKASNQFESDVKFKNQPFLSPDSRIALLQRYDRGNRSVAREFLDRAEGDMFLEERPDANEPWSPPEPMTAEEVASMIMRVMLQGDPESYKKRRRYEARLRRTEEIIERLRPVAGRLIDRYDDFRMNALWEKLLWGDSK